MSNLEMTKAEFESFIASDTTTAREFVRRSAVDPVTGEYHDAETRAFWNEQARIDRSRAADQLDAADRQREATDRLRDLLTGDAIHPIMALLSGDDLVTLRMNGETEFRIQAHGVTVCEERDSTPF